MVFLDLIEGRVGRCWSRWQLAGTVAEGHPAEVVHAHNVLVILSDFNNNNTCFVPLGGVIASLVLNTHVMTNFEWGKLACVFVPTFSELHVPVPESFLASG